MNELVTWLLGAPPDGFGSVVGAHFEARPALNWIALALLGAVTVAIAVLSYRTRAVEISRWKRNVLLGLRLAALLAILGILVRPVVGLTVEGLVRESVVLLFDQSASLLLRDPRVQADDRARAGIAMGLLSAERGLDQQAPDLPEPRPSRLELLQAILTNRELALVDRLAGSFDLRVMGFSQGVVGIPSVAAGDPGDPVARGRAIASQLTAEGRQTAPGTAIREVLTRERGRPLGGIVMFTDGIRNAGPVPTEAAEIARAAGVAIHVVALGTTAPRDLQIVEVAAPEVAFVRDEVPVSVRVRARGFGGGTVPVTLIVEGSPADEATATFEGDGEVTVPLRFTPEATGDFVIEVSVPARTDEILAENNRELRRIRVVDDRVRVLLVEQSPRWEFRYLQALLLRDRRIELKCVLFDGDPAIARSPNSPYLESFPARREELFEYDVVLFGDVDPRNFTPAQLEFLADFVSQSGGAVVMVAGRRFSPWSYRDTALERLLPVEFSRAPDLNAGVDVYDEPLKLDLTPEGARSPLLRLAEDAGENLRRWDALPPVFWVAEVGRAKPAADVLAVLRRDQDDGPGIPVIAMQQYGVGQSMFIGTDDTWRWRRNEGERFHVSFWGRVVQHMAIHHLLSGSRRTQLMLDRVSVLPGERLGVTARLFTTAFEPLGEPLVAARVEALGGDGEATGTGSELILRAVPDQPGMYFGELIAPGPGRYRLRVGDQAPASVDFTVEDRAVEAGETAMQEVTLRDLAEATGGGFFREEDLHRLPAAVRSGGERVRSRLTVDVWSSPMYFLGILFFLGSEWALRKWWQLK